MSNHVLGDKNRNELSPIMDCKGHADHIRSDVRPSGPRLDNLPRIVFLGLQYLLHEMVINKRTLFNRTCHFYYPLTVL